jgi:hypothetical protein
MMVGVAVGNQYLNFFFEEKAKNQTPPTEPSTLTMMIPTIYYVGATILLSEIWKYVARWLVKGENHRT